MIKSIKAIDLHSHINHGTPYDSLSNDSRIYKAEYDFLTEMYDRAGISEEDKRNILRDNALRVFARDFAEN